MVAIHQPQKTIIAMAMEMRMYKEEE